MSDYDDMTIQQWLDWFTERTGEKVTHLVLGDDPAWEGVQPNVVIPITDIPREVLDHKFDSGFGMAESPNLCGWSETYVVFSKEYDGAESLDWVPRHPVAHRPARA